MCNYTVICYQRVISKKSPGNTDLTKVAFDTNIKNTWYTNDQAYIQNEKYCMRLFYCKPEKIADS